jgi:sugar lactone lactonase YvrE
MRTLLIASVVLAADAGAPATPGRAIQYAEARRTFAQALGSGALDEARAALGVRRAAAPGRGDLAVDLARLEASAGQVDAAFAALEPVARMGLAMDLSTDAVLAPLRDDPRWAPLLSRFSAARAPVPSGGAEAAVPPGLGLVEDLAVDARSGAVFVSSVRTGEVWRGVGGKWRVWARPAPAGSGAFALAVDPVRGVLHVTVAAVPQAEGFRKADEGRSALVTLRLEDGGELARHVPSSVGPHLLGDLTLTPDGTVLVSDALAGTVYRLPPGGGALEALVPARTFASPQTPALSPEQRLVYVPDWTLGLFVLPLAGGVPEPVAGPDDLVTGGIDGLALAPGGLIAVQNGIVAPRLVRLWLSPDGRRVTRWKVLARGPELGDPTHVVATRRGALALIDSGWGRFDDDGGLRPGAPPTRPRLLGLDLH